MDLPLSNVVSVTQNDQLNNVVAMSEAGSGNAACVNETKVSANIQKIAVRVAANVCPSEQTALCAGRSGATTMSLQPSVHAADRSLLFFTEFLHRVKNEYACAISLATILEARSSNTPKPAVFRRFSKRSHLLQK